MTTALQDRLDTLNTAAQDRLAEIAKGNYETVTYAIAEFQELNTERLILMGLLNLIPSLINHV